MQEVLGVLAEAGFVHLTADGDGAGAWYWTSESYPADAVSLRSVSSDNFVIVDMTNGHQHASGCRSGTPMVARD